jgi:hypothetical protein
MTALVRMRVTGFVRAGRALAPLICGVVVISVLYGGGAAPAGEAYGVCAVVMFPVLAWQSKLLLDAEPDVQRRLARVSVGERRELVAGLLAAGVMAVPTVAIALVLPWLIGGIESVPGPGEPPLVVGVALGGWAHLIAVPAGVALGAVASRAVTGGPLYGVLVLVSGMVGVLVLGLRSSVVPWLTPPLMATARELAGGLTATTAVLLTAHALGWSAVVLAGYARLRHRRS